jgi:type II secretory pathway pseudopilin PulG
MDEVLKNRIVVILAILTVVFFFGTLSSCNSAIRQKAARDKEMVARLALEERTSKYVQEKSALEEKAKAKENQVQELKVSLDAIQKTLVQDQLVSQNLKEELQKVTKLKETLEEELKQALINGKKAKK